MQWMRAVSGMGYNNPFETNLYQLMPGACETLLHVDRALWLVRQTYLPGNEQGISEVSAGKHRFPTCR